MLRHRTKGAIFTFSLYSSNKQWNLVPLLYSNNFRQYFNTYLLRRTDTGYNPHRQASSIITKTFPAVFSGLPTSTLVHAQSP